MVTKRKKTWEQKVDLVNESFSRASSLPKFANVFYSKLFYLNPKIKEYFKNTDFTHQEKALMHGLRFMMGFLDSKDKSARINLARIAETHSHKNMNIHPHDYYYWGEALILTVKECDHLWFEDLKYYWKEVVFLPVSFIISQYYRK